MSDLTQPPHVPSCVSTGEGVTVPTATATPRTDDAQFYSLDGEGPAIWTVEADFARTLERELSSAQAALAEAKAEVARLNKENDKLNAECNEQALQLGEATRGLEWQPTVKSLRARVSELEQDKARLIAVVEPHIADLRGSALAIVRAGFATGLKNTIAEIEKAADELRSAIDAAKGRP